MSTSIIGDNELTVVGLLAALLLIVVREAFAFIANKNLQASDSRFRRTSDQIENILTDLKEQKAALDHITKKTNIMFEWHDKNDQDGVKVWYVRQSLENILRDNAIAIAAVARNSELQTRLLEEMLESQRILVREQAQLMRELREIQHSIDLKDK